ncbi:uncharacterized protein LOC125138849 [Tachysurus fulvidraco]|uniref:uncharacterized protein LOC125138849 n=1 Tax=Tachysurus fulvidraco TaxID=1234273 RepID=UPI001FEE148E|nr:uncharacterized protein LOC125138849 [Tachysurus fulvidraco]
MIRGVLRRSEDLGSGSDQTMFSTLLLLLLTATSGIKCIELVQPAVILVKPGESFSVPCKITGYSATSQCTNWIRQSGQKLELIGWYCSSSDTGRSSSFNTNMFASAPLLLLALAPYVFCATELIQPDSLLIKPGETLTITCKVSGASITDSSSHFGTAWIRQPAGKALEWINNIYYSGSIDKKDSLKDKFVVSRDTSSNSVTLRGQNMQTEDTAVYYCARVTHSDTTSCSAAQKPHHNSLL